MKPSDIFQISKTLSLIGKPIAYYPEIAKALGSIPSALFLCQMIYWEGKQSDFNGWIYKTMNEIEKETGMGRRQIEGARKSLRDKGILQEELKGIPAKLHFLIDWTVTDTILTDLLQGVQTSSHKTAKLGRTKQPSKSAPGSQPITENTTESTTENTTIKIFPVFMNRYFDFIQNELRLPKPNMVGVEGSIEGKSLKSIITYIKGLQGIDTDEKAIEVWEAILNNWKRLDSFLIKQIRLRDINNYILPIINCIKNGKAATGHSLDSFEAEVKQSFKERNKS